ncbi:putative cell cycle control protein [Plasmodium gaboni]|uniref:Putative cell cycle control protein n=1 Tax=Plasmodium gaboni TaxID=647221 RepID=A0A151LH18_9APIC|nr:putative cell cycle control protein [Plasmodium gaboni]KYN98177.1 putative cell cycle control protein [Plasmodium gaboni]
MSSREKDEKKKKHKDHKRNVDNNYNERIRREKKEKFRSSSSYSTDYANKRKRMRTTSSSYDSSLEIRKHKRKKKRRNNSYSSSNSYNSNTDNYSNYKKEKIKNKKDVKDKVASNIKKNNNKTHDESMSSTHSSKDKVKGKKNNKKCYEEYNSISSDKYNKKKKKKESSSSDNSSVYSMKRKKKDKRNGSYEGKNVYIRRSVSSRSVSSDSNKSYSNKSSSNKSSSNKSSSNKSSSNKSSSNKSSSNKSSSNISSSNKSYSHISKYGKKKKKIYDPLKDDEKNEETLEINEDLIEYAKQKISNVTIEDVGKAGGVYIPPFKLERLKNEVTNKKSVLYQKQEWMKLKKKINNIVNKVNIDNISEVCYELFECNLIRGKGLFSRALIHAQLSSPAFTNVFTCLLCIINSKFPNIGLLTIQRIIIHFRRAYQRNDKILCFNTVKFIAHMINQRIIHEIVGLQLCSLLLKNITNDSVQVCTYFLAEVGELYTNICRKGLDIIFDRLKDIIQEGQINIKTQYDIEKLWNYRKNNFKDFPSVHDDLNLIDEEEKIIHEIDLLDENFNSQEELNIFREVPYEQYEEEDIEWKNISQELLFGDDSSNEKKKKKRKNKETNGSDSEKLSNYELDENDNSSEDSEAKKSDSNESNDDENDSDESNVDDDDDNNEEIHDMTEQYLINLRKNVYLSIMSSLSYEECVHKLLKLNIKKGYEIEICNMLIDCCCMEKTFQTFYALQAERLCKLKKIYQENFEKCFDNSFNTAHRLETAKLRNCSKFFAHLLYTDAISWSIFKIIKLTEEDTTSSTRIFIKILLQELTNNLGLQTFYHKINHPAISPFLIGLFPTDNAQNIRFCINFFTAIGLGALTSSLRKLLIT